MAFPELPDDRRARPRRYRGGDASERTGRRRAAEEPPPPAAQHGTQDQDWLLGTALQHGVPVGTEPEGTEEAEEAPRGVRTRHASDGVPRDGDDRRPGGRRYRNGFEDLSAERSGRHGARSNGVPPERNGHAAPGPRDDGAADSLRARYAERLRGSQPYEAPPGRPAADPRARPTGDRTGGHRRAAPEGTGRHGAAANGSAGAPSASEPGAPSPYGTAGPSPSEAGGPSPYGTAEPSSYEAGGPSPYEGRPDARTRRAPRARADQRPGPPAGYPAGPRPDVPAPDAGPAPGRTRPGRPSGPGPDGLPAGRDGGRRGARPGPDAAAPGAAPHDAASRQRPRSPYGPADAGPAAPPGPAPGPGPAAPDGAPPARPPGPPQAPVPPAATDGTGAPPRRPVGPAADPRRRAGPPESPTPAEELPPDTGQDETRALERPPRRRRDPGPAPTGAPPGSDGETGSEPPPDDETGDEQAHAEGPREGKRSGPVGVAGRIAALTGRTTGPDGEKRKLAFWKELLLLAGVAILLTVLIQTFLAKVYVIPSGSMETTLHGCTGCTNDRVLVDKVTYNFTDISPGDIVVFRGTEGWVSESFTGSDSANPFVKGFQTVLSLVGVAPPDEKDFVKRVIAVGGQTVACCDALNQVMVDGQPLEEPYIYYLPEAGPARQIPFGPVTVPEGEYWMMGDSRNNSADSRAAGHGPIPEENIIGKVRMIVLPFDRFGWVGSTDPQQTADAAGPAGLPAGLPLALGIMGTLPLAASRRRTLRARAETERFLPATRRPDRWRRRP